MTNPFTLFYPSQGQFDMNKLFTELFSLEKMYANPYMKAMDYFQNGEDMKAFYNSFAGLMGLITLDEYKQLETKYEELKKKMTDNNKSAGQADEQITSLNKTISTNKAAITKNKKELTSLQNNIQKLETKVTEKDKAISDLQKQLDASNKKAEQLEADLKKTKK